MAGCNCKRCQEYNAKVIKVDRLTIHNQKEKIAEIDLVKLPDLETDTFTIEVTAEGIVEIK